RASAKGFCPNAVKVSVSGGPATVDVPLRKRRTKVRFLTIDNYDRCAPGEGGHGNNLARLGVVAEQWARDNGATLVVDTIFFPNVTQSTLDDPDLFAIFMAGSWPEWFELKKGMGKEHEDQQKTFKAALTPFMSLIKSSDIPIFAVCGSHQLLAAAYAGGFSALGHMLADPAHPTIDDE